MAELVAATLPNARRAAIPGAGHMAPQSHPIALAEMLKEFWRSL
jgi:pimeloyl-ACP methyl ester carboxylesterase